MIVFRPMQLHDLDWLAKRTLAEPARDIEGIVAEVEGERAAVVGCERWSETSAWVHLVVDDPRAFEGNELLDAIANHVFRERGRQFIFSTVSSENPKSIAFQHAIGFKTMATLPDAFAIGEDLLIMRLDADIWFKRRGH